MLMAIVYVVVTYMYMSVVLSMVMSASSLWWFRPFLVLTLVCYQLRV